MLKAKLVVKQGQKVMGLYAKRSPDRTMKRCLFFLLKCILLLFCLL